MGDNPTGMINEQWLTDIEACNAAGYQPNVQCVTDLVDEIRRLRDFVEKVAGGTYGQDIELAIVDAQDVLNGKDLRE